MNKYDDIMDFQTDQGCDIDQTAKPVLNENSRNIESRVRKTNGISPLFKTSLKRYSSHCSMKFKTMELLYEENKS